MKKLLLIIILLFSIIFTTSCSHTPVSTQPPASEAPTDTLPIESSATNEITWDQSKYEVMLMKKPAIGKKYEFELFHDYVACKANNHSAPESMPDKTVEFMGKSYTGEFVDSSCYWFCSRQRYRYRSDNVYFAVDISGTIKSFNFIGEESLVDDTAPKLSSTEAMAKAEEYFKQLTGIELSDSSYKAKSPIYEKALGIYPQYRILFYSYIGEIKTSNQIEITITETGELISYRNDDNTNFEVIDTSSVDMNEINSVFDDAIEYIYGGLRERFQVRGLERDVPTLDAHPDGTLVFMCNYSLSIAPKDADEMTMSTATESNTMVIIIRDNK